MRRKTGDRRKTSLKKYGISVKRYNELKAFCEQYQEWIDDLEILEPQIKSPSYDGMPHSITNSTSDPTSSLVIKRDGLLRKINLVRDTAKEACPDCYEYIIKNICYGQNFQYLSSVCNLPLSLSAFTDRKKYFFNLLNINKEK